MKLNNLFANTLAFVTFVTAAQADVEIRITGSTSFRAATIDTLKEAFDWGGNYTFAHNKGGGEVNTADRVTFRGTFPSITGITTVRCSFNGSVEGIRAIAQPSFENNPPFIRNVALQSPGTDPAEAPNENANVTDFYTEKLLAKFAFSDCRQTSTPIWSPTLNPPNPKIGVVVFAPTVNKGAPPNFTNVTSQQFKALFQTGCLPLSLFTADPADTKMVYATGRNDGSGARSIYLAESGLGVTKNVNQYVVTAATSTAINTIQLVPAGGANFGGGVDPTTASTLWGQDLDGNGGYSSGALLRTELAKTADTVTVLDGEGAEIDSGAGIYLVTFLATSDALAVRQLGGKILGWNGSILDSLNANITLSAADLRKITNGQYSAWSFENLYYNGSLTTDETIVYNAIKARIPTTLISAGRVPGIPLSEMNVSRPNDGAPIAP